MIHRGDATYEITEAKQRSKRTTLGESLGSRRIST
jgi:hypothetical protein